MSRNWTPQEQYYADKFIQKEQGRSMRDQEFFWVQPDGTKIPMEDEQSRKVRKQYSELGFLFDYLPKTYKALEKHPKYRKRVLDKIEQHLKEIEEIKRGNNQDIVWLWYTGKLDSNFYYNERNNELFMEYIITEVNKLVSGR